MAKQTCTRAQVNLALLGLGTALAGCGPGTSAIGPRRGAAPDDDSIPLGPAARLRNVLVSDQPNTTFTVSGAGADDDLLLPRTSIARVRLPRAAITIAAAAPCFRPQSHYLEAGMLRDGGAIAFTFSNYYREAGCDEARQVPAPAASVVDPGRLGWVIGQEHYREGWPDLAMVDADRAGMTRLLQRAGYRVTVSADRGRAELLRDAVAFRAALAQAPTRVALIYVSGHGVSLAGRNYLVPADAPGPASIRAEHLLALDELVRILDPVDAAGGCAALLVDACRSLAGTGMQTLVGEPPRRILVNHSTAPGGTSFDGDVGMSAWTQRFVTVAEDFPDAALDQLLLYANRYTRWQSETSQRVQVPVLYGRPAVPPPAFGAGPPPARWGLLPRLAA